MEAFGCTVYRELSIDVSYTCTQDWPHDHGTYQHWFFGRRHGILHESRRPCVEESILHYNAMLAARLGPILETTIYTRGTPQLLFPIHSCNVTLMPFPGSLL